MNKLKLSDNVLSCLTKMSDGNPGCLEFLMDVLKTQNVDTFYEIVIRLDNAELYGQFIYMLWNDCCVRDTYKTIRMIRRLDDTYKTIRMIRRLDVDTLRSYVINDLKTLDLYEDIILEVEKREQSNNE